MGCYLFQNGNVYFAAQGKAGSLRWDEFRSSDMTHDRHAHILVLEGEGGARFELVRRSREVFGRGCIRTLAPYAEGLRAYFRAHDLARPDENFFVADDLGDRVLLTVFRGGRAAMTRMIPSQDAVVIMDEIRRTCKSVQEKEPGVVLRIFTNRAGLKDTVFFETRFPAFDVLGKVKFPLLMLPEEAAEMKKRGRRVEFIKACLAALLMGGAGAGAWGCAGHAAAAIDARLGSLSRERAALENDLRSIGCRTYHSSVKHLPSVNFAAVFSVFLDNVPPESRLVSVVFQRSSDMTWDLAGTVMFPGQEIYPFAARGILSGAMADDINYQGKPGLRISLKLPERREVDK